MSPVLNAAKSAAVRRLATMTALACGLLAVAAPAAFANHVSNVAATGCTSVTFTYAKFPGGTIPVQMTILEADGTTVDNTQAGSFTGPNGTTTIPITDGTNGETIIPQVTWNKTTPPHKTKGSFNTKPPFQTLTLSCPPPPTPTFTGDAYNLGATGLVGVAPVNEQGPVSMTSPVSLSNTILSETIPLIGLTGSQLTSSLTAGGSTSTASTDVNALNASPLGIGLSTGEISDSSQTVCTAGVDATSGSTNIASLTLDGVLLVGPGGIIPAGPIPANTVVGIPGVATVTLNEQTPVIVGGKTVGLTVNAVDINLLNGTEDVIIGHAESDVENCA